MPGEGNRERPPSTRLPRVLLAAYALLVGLSIGLWLVGGDWEPGFPVFIAVFLGLQWLFVALRGDVRILTPMEPRKRLVPCLIGGALGAVLVAAVGLALGELMKVDGHDVWEIVFCIIVGASWLAWTAAFYVYAARNDSLKALRAIIMSLLGGSVVSLLATVPSHVVVARRPGCLVGLGTMTGIFGGLLVMAWAFGPGILLLFYYQARRAQPGHCRVCAYDLTGNQSGICPECGTPTRENCPIP